jgi:uracil-DNA glycosylase family 4
MRFSRKSLDLADRAMGLTHRPRREHGGSPTMPSARDGDTAPASTPDSRASGLQASTTLPIHPEDASTALALLRRRHDAECPHCTTATGHTQTVFGEGDPQASLMFIGEAPGETEDRTGRPFVGRAGDKLAEMIRAMGLSRDQVYIANVLKSRPPDNRTPLEHEVQGCGPYLIEQILIVKPKVLVTLGGPATKLILGTDVGITRLRGIWAQWQPPAGRGDAIPVLPTYHPAYLLRNYTPKTRGEVWEDLQKVMDKLGLRRPAG